MHGRAGARAECGDKAHAAGEKDRARLWQQLPNGGKAAPPYPRTPESHERPCAVPGETQPCRRSLRSFSYTSTGILSEVRVTHVTYQVAF